MKPSSGLNCCLSLFLLHALGRVFLHYSRKMLGSALESRMLVSRDRPVGRVLAWPAADLPLCLFMAHSYFWNPCSPPPFMVRRYHKLPATCQVSASPLRSKAYLFAGASSWETLQASQGAVLFGGAGVRNCPSAQKRSLHTLSCCWAPWSVHAAWQDIWVWDLRPAQHSQIRLWVWGILCCCE